MDVIVGTAGHIDHGKTALVKALTGIDADRLPEEKSRGITIDLGFAEMSANDVHFGFVDVPGHERFVRNMLAGASGIDVVLLVVAADEGVMPQTREHFDICRLLGLRSGVIAITKADLVDAETLELAELDISELVAGSFLENAPLVATSSRTGAGIDRLRDALVSAAAAIPEREQTYVTRIAIDRSFTMKGFGAVVTGTLASGELREGSEMELLPDRRDVRIRGLQTHGRSVTQAHAGQRTAINLAGIGHGEITRGMTLSEPSVLEPTQTVDAYVEVLPNASKPLRSRQRVRMHLGTAEVLARVHVLNDDGQVAPGSNGYVQVRSEDPVVAVAGERFIFRSYSPQMTIAGGEIVDPIAARHRRKEFVRTVEWLEDLRRGSPHQHIQLLVDVAGKMGVDLTQLQHRTGYTRAVLQSGLSAAVKNAHIVDARGVFITSTAYAGLKKLIHDSLWNFHRIDPLSAGMTIEQLRSEALEHVPDEIVKQLLADLEREEKIVVKRETVRLTSHKTELSVAEAKFLDSLRAIYSGAGLEVPKLDNAISSAAAESGVGHREAGKLLRLLVNGGDLVKVDEELYFSRGSIDDLVSKIRQSASRGGGRTIDVAAFKDIAGVSRKYAIPLLEYFDREKITARTGDKRVVI